METLTFIKLMIDYTHTHTCKSFLNRHTHKTLYDNNVTVVS